MSRVVLAMTLFLIFSCKNNDKKESNPNFTRISQEFKKGALPYQLKEEGLTGVKDSGTSVTTFFAPLIPDTLKAIISSKSARVQYYPMVKIENPEGETYFIIKAISGNKISAIITAYNKEKNFADAIPFLVIDDDETTTQTTILDDKYNISRNTVRKKGIELLGEGKNVFAFDRNSNKFSWIMTDLLDESTEVINPIDTLPKKHEFSGDYLQNNSIVSIRDGRHENQLQVFIHFENKEGNCTGEMKGDFILTSKTTAEYRQGGDPCVIKLSFTKTSVSLSEIKGCGNYRGMNCEFTGTFNRKKK